MNIVVLDGYTVDPGDLSWAPLEALGTCVVYPRTPPALVIERAREAAIVLTNKTRLDRASFEGLPALRYVGVLATGYDVVDVGAARERGIVVCNVPGYAGMSVAQHVFALILALTNQVGEHDRRVRIGEWTARDEFSFVATPIVELEGATLGIVGVGDIGRRVARIAASLGMHVIAARRPGVAAHDAVHDAVQGARGIERLDIDALFRCADVVSLHCPLDAATRGLVDATRLASMKPSAFLINTARGGLIDSQALRAALDAGQIAGAGLDVLDQEPPAADHPLVGAPRLVLTPHNAWASRAARQRLLLGAVDNVRAFLAGTPINRV